MKTEIDKVNDLIIEGLESQIKIKDEITASLRASNEYLLEKLVRFDIRNEELENELKTFK
jgi:flagellin-specific chaperone FliS